MGVESVVPTRSSLAPIDDGGHEGTWVPRPRPVGSGGTDAGLARILVELAQVSLDSADPADAARRMSGVCEQAFQQPVAVSLTFGDPLEPDLVATQSAEAQSLDGAQLIAGEGPCAEAWRTSTAVASQDLSSDERWPRLHPHLAERGNTSAIGLPLLVDDRPAGTMNVYGTRPIDAGDLEASHLVASTVATVLQEVTARAELATLAGQLSTALESRAVIDQAKGIVMARHGCDADDAFRILARISSNTNVKLRLIARQVVDEATAGRLAT